MSCLKRSACAVCKNLCTKQVFTCTAPSKYGVAALVPTFGSSGGFRATSTAVAPGPTHILHARSRHQIPSPPPPALVLPPSLPFAAAHSHSWPCSHTPSLPINCMVSEEENMRVLCSMCNEHIDVIPLERLALLAAAGACSTLMGGGRSRATRNLLFLADVVRVLLSWVPDAR